MICVYYLSYYRVRLSMWCVHGLARAAAAGTARQLAHPEQPPPMDASFYKHMYAALNSYWAPKRVWALSMRSQKFHVLVMLVLTSWFLPLSWPSADKSAKVSKRGPRSCAIVTKWPGDSVAGRGQDCRKTLIKWNETHITYDPPNLGLPPIRGCPHFEVAPHSG